MNIPAFYGSESGHSDLVNMLYQSRSGHPAEHLLQGALDPHKLQRTWSFGVCLADHGE